MPFPVAHGLVGVILGLGTKQSFSRVTALWFGLLCAALAILPDIDFVFDWVFHLRGWHRGFTHSIAFGIATGLLASLLVGAPQLRDRLALVLASVSHGLLDTLVSDRGGGIALLWPFSHDRYEFVLVDYFAFTLNPRVDSFAGILIYTLKVSLLELLILGPLFLLVIFVKQRTA